MAIHKDIKEVRRRLDMRFRGRFFSQREKEIIDEVFIVLNMMEEDGNI